MAVRLDLRSVVAERGRRIAREAEARSGTPRTAPRASNSGWLGRALGLLPDPVRAALREALGPDALLDEARQAMARLKRERDDLRHREGALDEARGDLDRARRSLDEARIEMGAREREVEKLLARAQRAAAEASVERRVPLAAVRWDADASPRPIRGVARLAANIKRFGQLTPLVVRPVGDHFELVSGYRRMAALGAAGFTHASVRVVADLDDATAAALYVAENCLVDGVSSNAVKHLAQRAEGAGFDAVLPLVLADDDEAVEELYLEDMAEEARHHLAEGAAWVSALRPYWSDLEADDRGPLEQLVVYFAKVASRLR